MYDDHYYWSVSSDTLATWLLCPLQPFPGLACEPSSFPTGEKVGLESILLPLLCLDTGGHQAGLPLSPSNQACDTSIVTLSPGWDPRAVHQALKHLPWATIQEG